MPKTIETVVYTIDELYEREDSSAIDRALDWMREVWSDHTVESVTEALDEFLTELCGGEYDPTGRRTGPITWVEWSMYPRYIKIEADFSPDELSTSNFLFFPCPVIVERVTLGRYGLNLTIAEDLDDGENKREYELVEAWLKHLVVALTNIMVSEYEYLTGDEHLRDCAIANEYTFTATGKPFG